MNWMMQAIAKSRNKKHRLQAEYCLRHELTLPRFVALFNPDTFMFSVAKGDEKRAWEAADFMDCMAFIENVSEETQEAIHIGPVYMSRAEDVIAMTNAKVWQGTSLRQAIVESLIETISTVKETEHEY